MELGSLPSLAKENPKNLVVLINDNETYHGVGGYPTLTAFKTDLAAMARGAGLEHAVTVRRFDDFKKEVDECLSNNDRTRFIVMKTEHKGYRAKSDTFRDVEVKCRFLNHVEQTEGVEIFPRSLAVKKLMEKP